MKIIDFERKGNVVRFYLGEDDLKDWCGDDWNDYPYECNAGPVSEKYISGHKEISFGFDELVLEPSDGEFESGYSKDDMKKRRIPCIIVVPKEEVGWGNRFSEYIGNANIKKYYMGDKME